MAIGMTYDQYWYGDPMMARQFYEAHKLKKEMRNELAWINGLYVLKALQATVGNIVKKKTDKPFEYPDKPIEIGEPKANVESTVSEEQEVVVAKAYMLQMMAVGKNWGKKD